MWATCPATIPTMPLTWHQDRFYRKQCVPKEPSYNNRGVAIGTKIRSLLRVLGPSTYDEISPKIEYWIEHALTEQSVNVDDLVERLSLFAWDSRNSEFNAAVARFLKDFHDAPHRSEQARSTVDRLCTRVFRWFAAASAEDLSTTQSNNPDRDDKVAISGEEGFVRAASVVGHLIERDLLSHELVRRDLIKPLTAHHYTDRGDVHKACRAAAIYRLLTAAGNTLLQGLLEPEDVQACFETLDSELPLGRVAGLDAEKLTVRRATRSYASHHDLIHLVRTFARSTPRG